MEANCGPLSLDSLIGIPYSSKMLLRMLMVAWDDKVVSFLTIGNLEKMSPASRYVLLPKRISQQQLCAKHRVELHGCAMVLVVAQVGIFGM